LVWLEFSKVNLLPFQHPAHILYHIPYHKVILLIYLFHLQNKQKTPAKKLSCETWTYPDGRVGRSFQVVDHLLWLDQELPEFTGGRRVALEQYVMNIVGYVVQVTMHVCQSIFLSSTLSQKYLVDFGWYYRMTMWHVFIYII